MSFYAHTSKLSDGKTTNSDPATWEPLFTPFGTREGDCQHDIQRHYQNAPPAFLTQ